MTNTFQMTFGGSIATKLGVDNTEPAYESAPTGRFLHWVRDVPYKPELLTPAAKNFVAHEFTQRRTLICDGYRPDDWPEQFGTPPKYIFTRIPHADSVDDILDCTDWLNRTATSTAYTAE